MLPIRNYGGYYQRHPQTKAPEQRSQDLPEHQPQIVGGTLERIGLGYILHAPEPGPPASSRFADMRKGSLAPLAAPTVQSPPLFAAHSSSVGSKGCFMSGRLVFPAPDLLAPFGNVGAHLLILTRHQQSVVMI